MGRSSFSLPFSYIIVETFAALTLATDPASKSLLDRKPDTRGTRLFIVDTTNVTRSITEAQCLFT